MHELTELIRNDMLPALGVTEPGALAFCAAKARACLGGELRRLKVVMNSGLYKNAFTCGIPNSDRVGAVFAAALGYVAGDASKGLEALDGVTEADNAAAARLVEEGKVVAELGEISSRILIQTLLETDEGCVELTVRDTHTGIAKIVRNGQTLFERDEPAPGAGTAAAEGSPVHRYTLAQLLDYVQSVPLDEIAFVSEAYRVNLALFEAALQSPRTSFARRLLAMNGGRVYSSDELRTASLLCNAAIEGRVVGLELPAMSITGSGAHGIIATMPLYAVYRLSALSEEALYRATMLSYLVCTYIKEYSGRLSAFCGCGIAAGTGMAVALCYLKGGDLAAMERVINNMASSITGMICDGGTRGCAMKGVAACAAAFESVALALGGVGVESVHGINGATPEQTMRNMGLIASPGMVGTEKTIVEIQQSKTV